MGSKIDAVEIVEDHDEDWEMVPVEMWSNQLVTKWLISSGFDQYARVFREHQVDGATLLLTTEEDLRQILDVKILADLKKLSVALSTLKEQALIPARERWIQLDDSLFKFLVSFVGMLVVGFITAFVMAVVHDKVPNPDAYPPLPDIFLDNIAAVPWAFEVVEWIILALGFIFAGVVILHKHRLIVLRRFCVLGSFVFLLRCVTMYVTSLSVPGSHLKCDVRVGSTFDEKLVHSWKIVSGLALSINGVRTCGDYLFSGHSVMLTLFNYAIMEYTPHKTHWRELGVITWSLNIVGMFFVLAAHEHYSIDVLLAFIITSRLWCYYHSLANATQLVGADYERQRSFFPLFNYWEEFTRGVVPNEFITIDDVAKFARSVVRKTWHIIYHVTHAYRYFTNSKQAKEPSPSSSTSAPSSSPLPRKIVAPTPQRPTSPNNPRPKSPTLTTQGSPPFRKKQP